MHKVVDNKFSSNTVSYNKKIVFLCTLFLYIPFASVRSNLCELLCARRESFLMDEDGIGYGGRFRAEGEEGHDYPIIENYVGLLKMHIKEYDNSF